MTTRSWISGNVMSFLALGCSIATATAAEPAAPPVFDTLVYFGTYTGAKSKGIYFSRFNAATGKFAPAELAVETPSPSFLAVAPNRRYVYAVNEVGSFGGQASGAVSSFSVDPVTGKLTQLSQRPSGGSGPCHLAVDASGRFVAVANYGGGSTTVLPIDPTGTLGPATAFVQHKGSSIDPKRQEKPHAHSVTFDRANQHLFVADLGLDKILSYEFDARKGGLTANFPSFMSVELGAGPRHFTFDRLNHFAFVINELDCTVTAYSYVAGQGMLSTLQTISTLPVGEAVQPGFSTAELVVHPSGRYLYGSNRGHHSIVVYSINQQTGRLNLVEHQSTRGKTPRNFAIDPSGRWLFAANQDSDNVVIFRINQLTGRLEVVGEPIEVPTPVCVTFLPQR